MPLALPRNLSPVTILALLACTTPPPAPAQDQSTATLATAVDAFVERAFAQGLSPALGVAIVKDGRLGYARNLGVISTTRDAALDADSYWYIASTSKSMTGMAASLLADRGVLRLDDAITTLLPEVAWHPSADAGTLTLADFLGHRTGLGGGALIVSTAFTGAIPDSALPGLLITFEAEGSREVRYSNLGYEVARFVIDRFVPEGWRTFQERELFLPAGMRHTHTRVSAVDRDDIILGHELQADGTWQEAGFHKVDATMGAAGGHIATLADLARWAMVQMDSGRIDGRQVYPKSAVVLSQTALARKSDEADWPFAMWSRPDWGAGWDIGTYGDDRMVSRFGSYNGIRSHLSFLPGRRIGVVAMASGDRLGSALTDIIAAYAYDLDAGRLWAADSAEARLQRVVAARATVQTRAAEASELQVRREAAVPARSVQDVVGRYHAPHYGTVAFYRQGDRLRFRWGVLEGPALVQDAAAMRWSIPVGGTIVFQFDGPGTATGLLMRGELFRRIE